MAEGYGLEIGNVLRGAVVLQLKNEQPPTWLSSINAGYLGEYSNRDDAMKRVEENIESEMQLVLHDWELYQVRQRPRG